MCIQITQLANDVHRKRGVCNQRIARLRGRSGRRVGEVGDECASEHPVVRAVLEDVAHGHGGQAEAVDKHSLQLTLEEVCRDHDQAECLKI